ncbi:SpoIIE family protein phosphatase [Streptomyces sp. CB01881]|uniref:SpoIIE family protein phosphatase n=1 Tax=Streptomyces sp. CB01881 TaxID=2078691 RepID=UPI0011DFDDE6|nr:SpoIIE family protein phosphatase [Streptomyces sp. CB01881]TYC76273.1 ANTAR domain-containing protein [Streptomyces sp. CB01881]
MSEPAGDSSGTSARTGETAVLREAVDRLRAEADGLRRAMRSRGVIEQAKGMLTERLGCTPDEAFGHLVQLSQDTNRKLADIAAGLVGIAAPLEGDTAVDEDLPVPGPVTAPAAVPPRLQDPHPPVPAPPAAARLTPVPGLAARYHLAASALAGADTPEELARLLHEVALAPLGVLAVVLGLLEPDGALALVGSHGVEPRRISQWRRIPPETGVPLVAAAHGGGMVWEFDPDRPGERPPDTGRIVPGRIACAVPLRRGDRIVGAMSLGWEGRADRARAASRYVDALANLAAGHLLRVGAAGDGGPGLEVPGGEYWFRAVLDAMYAPVLVLSAVRRGVDGGSITDLRVGYANAAAGPGPAEGRRLSELHPGLVASGAFERILGAAADGVPYEGWTTDFTRPDTGAAGRLSLRAVPFLDGVLLTWRHRGGAAERAARLGEAHRLAGLGSFWWSAGSPGLELSEEALRMLGLDPGRAGATPAEVLACVAPADRPAVRLLARRLLAGQRNATLEVAVGTTGAGPRTVRVTAEALTAPAGGPARTVRGVVQDVTAWHRTEQALTAARARLAEQRRRAGAEHRMTRALQSALMPTPTGPDPSASGLDHAARYLPAGEQPRVGGDWYDLLPLPDGTVLLAVGDVSGHGVAAAVGMAELRHALRGLCYTGAGPAAVLGRLNTMLCHQGSRHIASVLCGLLDPAARALVWSAAGHPPPAVLRAGTAALAQGPAGTVLGADRATAYRDAELALRPGDTVLLWTDGLLNRREGGSGRPEPLLRAAEECGATALADCLDHIVAGLGGPNPADDSCLLAVRLPPAVEPGPGR